MHALDRNLPQFDVNEIHEIELDVSPEEALDYLLSLSVTPDWVVLSLFRIRGLRGLDLSLERFATKELGLDMVERTSTTAVAAGRLRRQRVAILFQALPSRNGGSKLVTETRVADVDLRFRLYWLVVGPFSALIRRRWLRAVATRSDRPPLDHLSAVLLIAAVLALAAGMLIRRKVARNREVSESLADPDQRHPALGVVT